MVLVCARPDRQPNICLTFLSSPITIQYNQFSVNINVLFAETKQQQKPFFVGKLGLKTSLNKK